MVRFIEHTYQLFSNGKDGRVFGTVTVRPFDGAVTVELIRSRSEMNALRKRSEDAWMALKLKDMMEPTVLSPEDAATVAAGLRIIHDTLRRAERQRGLSVVRPEDGSTGGTS